MNSKLYILILFLLCGFVLHAQKKVKLSGRVIDANNEGIELASIRIEGTTQGTMTDLKGNYEIYVAPADIRAWDIELNEKRFFLRSRT